MFTTRFEAWVRRHAEALTSALGRLPLTPNQVTVVGVLLTFFAGGLIAFGHLRWAGVVLVFAGACDILDGALARSTNAAYPYGAFLDSTLDRYSEAVLYFGLLVYILGTGDARLGALLIYATICGSILVSYARAKAESLGYKLQVGLLARPERIIILAVGLMLHHVVWALWFLAIFTNLTAAQRIYHLWWTTHRQHLPAGKRKDARP